jgi:DNA-binding protein HU-beta
MNKAELIDAMASGAGISKASAASALNSFIDSTSNALKSGDRVALVGFGSFSVTHREARKGRNPQTGKEITIAAKNVVKFKPGSDLNTKGEIYAASEQKNLYAAIDKLADKLDRQLIKKKEKIKDHKHRAEVLNLEPTFADNILLVDVMDEH